MLDIRPVSDLRNKFTDIEKAVQVNGHVASIPNIKVIYLTRIESFRYVIITPKDIKTL